MNKQSLLRGERRLFLDAKACSRPRYALGLRQVLSSYVSALTGISQLELNRSGVPFEEAMARAPRSARTRSPPPARRLEP